MSTSDRKYDVLALRAIATIKHALSEKYAEYTAELKATNPDCHIQHHAADATLEEWACAIFDRYSDKAKSYHDPTAAELRKWVEEHLPQNGT